MDSKSSKRAKKATKQVTQSIRTPSDDEIREQIAVAAYYRAAQRGFAAGDPQRDWLEAEHEVLAKLGKLNPTGTAARN